MNTTKKDDAICSTPAQRRFLNENRRYGTGFIAVLFGREMFDAGDALDGYCERVRHDPDLIEFIQNNFEAQRSADWFRKNCVRATRDTKAKAMAMLRRLRPDAPALPPQRGTEKYCTWYRQRQRARRNSLQCLIDVDWTLNGKNIENISYRSLKAKVAMLADMGLTQQEHECFTTYVWNLRNYTKYLWAMDHGFLTMYDLDQPLLRREIALTQVTILRKAA